MYFEQIKMTKGIPFPLKIPNDETVQAMEDARGDVGLEEVSVEQLKEQVGR